MAVSHLALKAHACDPAVTLDPDAIHMDGLSVTLVDARNPDKKAVKGHKSEHVPHVNEPHLDENAKAENASALVVADAANFG